MYRYLILVLFWTSFFAWPRASVSAQQGIASAHIVVQVVDPSGGIVPNARVMILPTPATVRGDQRTDNPGEFKFDVPPGVYDLRAIAQGFLPQSQRVDVQGGTSQKISLTLGVRSCGQDCMPREKMSAALVDFPEQSQAISPDGRYAILAVDPGPVPQHTLVFEDRILKTRRPLLSYERHVTVLWHLSSRVFAVTEYVGNDNSQCRIYSVDDTSHPISVLERLYGQLPEPAKESLKAALASHSTFVEAQDWVYPTNLMLMVTPYSVNSTAGFEAVSWYPFYELNLDLDDPPLPVNSHFSENPR